MPHSAQSQPRNLVLGKLNPVGICVSERIGSGRLRSGLGRFQEGRMLEWKEKWMWSPETWLPTQSTALFSPFPSLAASAVRVLGD